MLIIGIVAKKVEVEMHVTVHHYSLFSPEYPQRTGSRIFLLPIEILNLSKSLPVDFF